MSVAAVRRVVSRLETDDPPTDATLVAAIISTSAEREAAFAELVARYGPMVLGVCRRTLIDVHDAEDAFQAVFVVLARKAKNIQPPGAVGGWLHGVAVRTAQKAKVAAARRRRREMIATARANFDHKTESQPDRAADELHRTELRAVIDAELAALPEMQRAAVVLCDLHGRTRADAAAALNRPEGTVAAWLARGRKTLAARLARRGIVLPAGGLVAVATPVAVSAELTSSVVATFLGRSANAAVLTLAEGVMRSLSSSAKLGMILGVTSALLIAVATAMAWQPCDETDPIVESLTVPIAAPVPKPEPDVKAFLDHRGFIYSVSYAPSGKTFVSVGNGTANVWDTERLKKLFSVDAEFAAFSGDGKSLFVLVKDEFRTLDATTGKSLGTKPRQLPKSLYPGRTAGFFSTPSMWVEFDGARHHLRSELTDKSPDLADQYELGILTGPPAFNYGRGAAFSPDGKLFAGLHRMLKVNNSEQGVLSLWHPDTGKRVGTILRDANHPIHAFVWSPNGSEIAVAYADSIRIYDAKTLKELRKFERREITALAWSKDAKVLAVAHTVGINEAYTLAPYQEGVDSKAFKIAVTLIDATTGKQLRRIEGFPDNLPVISLAFRPDGKQLLCGAGFFLGDAPAVNVPHPAKDAAGLRVIPIDAKPDVKPSEWSEKNALDLTGWLGGSVAYSADGKTLFVGGTSGHVEAYAAATWKKLWEYKGGESLAAVAVAPDGKMLAATFKDSGSSGVQFLDSGTGKVGDKLEEKNALKDWPEPIAVAWFPNVTLLDGRGSTVHKVIYGNARQYVTKTWLEGGKPSTIQSSIVAAGKKPADEYAVPIAVSPDGQHVVVTGPIDRDTGKNVLWAWSAGSGAGNKLLEAHKATVVSAAWSKDSKFIVTGDSEGVVIVWNGTTLTNFKEMSRLTLGGRVASVAIADDSKHIAAAVVKPQEGKDAYTEEVFIWARANPPKKPEPISSHSAGGPFRGIASVAFAPDGMSLVSTFANFDHLTKLGVLVGKVRVFALKSPPEQPEKPAPVGKYITDVSFSPDGKLYLVVSGGEAKAFDTATRKELYAVRGYSARFTADGKKLFVMATKVLECDPTTGKTLKEYDPPKTKWGWHQVVFSPDGKRFAAHFGMFVGVYETTTGKEVKLDEQYEMAGYLANAAGEQVIWSPDGKYLLANGVLLKRSVMGPAVWDVESGKRTQTFEPAPGVGPRVVAYSADGKQLAIAYEKHIEVWSDGKMKAKLGEQGLITALAFHPKGEQLAIGMRLPQFPASDFGPLRIIGYKTRVRLIDIATDKAIKDFDDFESNVLPVTALTFSPDGTKLIAGTGIFALDELPKEIPKAGELQVFDLTKQDVPAPAPTPAGRQWTNQAVLTDHQSLVNGVAIAPDGKSFAAATEINVTCWDSATHKVLWTYTSTDSVAFALAYSPDGKHLWVAGKNAVIRLDAQSGKNAKTLDDLFGARLKNFNFMVAGSRARAITLSQDGKRLAFSDGYIAWMLDLEDPTGHGTFGGTTPKDAPPAPAGVAWAPDGKRLAAIHPKHTKRTFPSGVTPDTHWPVRIWSTEGKGLIRSLLGHEYPVTALAWSKDGKVIASGDEKGTLILWDAETGKELWRRAFRGRDLTDGRINALVISPLDNTIAAAVSLGSGKAAERVVLLDSANGKELEQLIGPGHYPVSSVAWSKDGTFLVTGCGAADQPVVRWDPFIGEVVVWKREP